MNLKRFKMSNELYEHEDDEDESAKVSAAINATEHGVIQFKLAFDDREIPTYVGETFEAMVKVGYNSVYFLWEVEVKQDPDWEEKMAQREAESDDESGNAVVEYVTEKASVVKEKTHSVLDMDGDGKLTVDDVKRGATQIVENAKKGVEKVKEKVIAAKVATDTKLAEKKAAKEAKAAEKESEEAKKAEEEQKAAKAAAAAEETAAKEAKAAERRLPRRPRLLKKRLLRLPLLPR